MKQLMFMLLALLAMHPFYHASAQKHMMRIDDSLKANSEFMEAKRRSIGGAGRYEFGPYKIISARKGVTTTKSRSKLFSPISESESEQASSFVFTANDKDTVVANLLLKGKAKVEHSNSLVLHGGKLKTEPNEPEVKENQQSFQAVISAGADTVGWTLSHVGRYNRDSSDFHSIFILSDGMTEFEIKEINDPDDGRTSMIWMFHGYEFFLNGIAVAAVQTLAKQYVWLRNGLDERLKLVLASAAAVLLFRDM